MDFSLGYVLVIVGALVSDVVILVRLRRSCRVDRTMGLLRSGIVASVVVFVSLWLLAHAWPADLTLVCGTSAAVLAFGITSLWRPS